jgi:hypothetical protein
MHCVGAIDVAGDGFSKSVGVECEVNLERKSLIRSPADLGGAYIEVPDTLSRRCFGRPHARQFVARALVLGADPVYVLLKLDD